MKKLVCIISVILVSAAFAFAQAGTMTLITSEEGALNEAPSGLYEAGRVYNDGPGIRIISPDVNNNNKPPVRIEILFIPSEGHDVDLSKLKVEYLKLLTIDLTDRVKPYVSRDGIKIDKAELPAGKHTLRITVGDINGGMTQETFSVTLR